jgi:HAD superfamily hydrolase (TIGR01509 family)
MKLHHLKSIVFDMDGTLVDSKLDFDQIRRDIGMPQDQAILEYLEEHPDADFVAKAMEIVHHHEREGALRATLIPGIDQLIEVLKQKNIHTGVLTRNSKIVTDLTLKNLKLSFEHVLTRDDCKPKPHPEGLILLSERFRVPCQQMAYVGDFLFDIQTAKAAKAMAILYTGGNSTTFAEQADLIIDDYHDLIDLILETT